MEGVCKLSYSLYFYELLMLKRSCERDLCADGMKMKNSNVDYAKFQHWERMMWSNECKSSGTCDLDKNMEKDKVGTQKWTFSIRRFLYI